MSAALHEKHQTEKPSSASGSGETTPRSDSPGLELTTQLPEAAATNDRNVPTYLGLTGNKLITAITACATTGFLLFGYDQGVMSGLITGPEFTQTFPAVDPLLQGSYKASVLQSTYVAIYELGCLVGASFALFFGNKLGRLSMMRWGSVILTIGVVIQVSAVRPHNAGLQFCIGRVITGIGNGMNTATIPSWVAETSRSHNRGLLVCIEASMVAVGTAIAYWVDFGLSFIHTSLNWRLPIALQVLFAFLLFAGTFKLPESPRWLMHEGRHIDAQRVIAALTDDTYDSEATLSQTRLIMSMIEESHQVGAVKKRHVFTNGPPQHLRRMLLGASSQIFQQIGGCNAVIYFCPVIFETYLGLDRQLSLILGGVNVTVYALCAFGSYFLVERVGRRKMFLVGSGGQALAMFIAFVCMTIATPAALKGAVFGLFLFLAFFGSTWLELPWLYPAEVNPLRTRTIANAISTQMNWLWNFAVVEFTPPFLQTSAWGCFFFFFVMNLLFIPVIYLFYIETAGRTLEEIDLIFASGFASGKSYVKVAAEMDRKTDDEVRSELGKLARDHEAKKARGEIGGSAADDATFVEAAKEAREDGNKEKSAVGAEPGAAVP